MLSRPRHPARCRGNNDVILCERPLTVFFCILFKFIYILSILYYTTTTILLILKKSGGVCRPHFLGRIKQSFCTVIIDLSLFNSGSFFFACLYFQNFLKFNKILIFESNTFNNI